MFGYEIHFLGWCMLAGVAVLVLGGLSLLLTEDRKVYLRRAELIFHKKFYPDWEKEKYPRDPETGEKLLIKPYE